MRVESDTQPKLVAVADGPFPVHSFMRNTFIIENHDNKAERVSKNRVKLVPKLLDHDDVARIVTPITDQEQIPAEFRAPQKNGMKNVLSSPNRPVPNILRRQKPLRNHVPGQPATIL